MLWWSVLYLGSVSADVPQGHASMLTLFDGVAGGAVAVDLHFFSCSYYGSVSCLLLQLCRVLFHHSFINVYGHIHSSYKPCKTRIAGLQIIYIGAGKGVLERPLLSRPEGGSSDGKIGGYYSRRM